ncbi:hypothetical protein N9D84_03170 [Planktomarina temperata]|nr:hypothetical protein [Planktomarina temperata]
MNSFVQSAQMNTLRKTSAQPNRQATTLCLMATPGRAGLPPGRRIHHLGILAHMVIAQILQRFHHQTYAPAQAGAAFMSC